MTIWHTSGQAPEAHIIQKAVAVVRQGGVIVFPTSTLYGMGADAGNPQAIRKIYAIKARSLHQPILILIGETTWLPPLVKEIPPAAADLMEAFWPGGMTMVFRASDQVSPELMGDTGKIGIRLPVHPVAAAIVSGLGSPLTGTSANLSGQAGCADIADLDGRVAGQLDAVVDAGPLKGGRGSTIIDVTEDPPRILRDGTISRRQIQSVL
jgi:L-threonylcarbamoyladenylate synthase